MKTEEQWNKNLNRKDTKKLRNQWATKRWLGSSVNNKTAWQNRDGKILHIVNNNFVIENNDEVDSNRI